MNETNPTISSLPPPPTSAPPPPVPPPPSVPPPSARGLSTVPPESLRVLVVDDDEDAGELLRVEIGAMGYDCRRAHDGQEAWEMHQVQRAHVILSDWDMPRMNGLELCRRTRQHDPADTYTYFIFMTGFDDRDHFARGIEAGADDYHSKPIVVEELRAQLASAGRVLKRHRSLASSNADLKRDSEASFRVARVDALTQVQNRFSMDEDLQTLWARVMRYGHRYSLAMCDVDRFKEYNDAFGHLAGDDVLQRVARTIKAGLREGDGHYRFGGEEFVLVLPEQSLAEAAGVMERVRGAVERLGIPGGRGGVVTVSLGVAELDRVSDRGPANWLGRADTALYRAKANGRNRVEVAEA